MAETTNRIYLTGAQARRLPEVVGEGQLVVLHQEDILTGREAIRGWVMVETIDGQSRETVTLDNEGVTRTTSETRSVLGLPELTTED